MVLLVVCLDDNNVLWSQLLCMYFISLVYWLLLYTLLHNTVYFIAVHTWKPDSVNKWLSQLNPSLHQLYESIFMEHNITGAVMICCIILWSLCCWL